MITKKSFCNGVFLLGLTTVLLFSKHAAAQESSNTGFAVNTIDPVIGSPFTISTEVIDEVSPVVTYNSVGREYLVVWENIHPAATNDIYAQRISEQGKFLSWFYVADGDSPAVTYNQKNNTYLIVYVKWASPDYDIYARRVDFNGPLGPEFPIAFNLNESELYPAVAYNTHTNHDEFLVVWENIVSQPTTAYRVEGQLVAGTAGGGDGGGETIGSRLPIAVNNHENHEPDVAYNLNMNEYLVVFTRYPAAGGSYDVYGRRVTGNGVLLAENPIDSSGNDQYEPAVAAYRLNQATPYLVVFTDSWNDPTGDVRGYLVNQQGQSVSLVNIATTPGQKEYEPSISQSEGWGGYLVSWTQSPLSDLDVYGRRVSNTGVTKPIFLISAYDPVPLGCYRDRSANAAGKVSALAVWADTCGGAGGYDIVGRMLGYQVYLPMVVQ